MLLVANSCLAQLLLSCDILAITVLGLQKDLAQIYYQDPTCIFRGYLSYAATGIFNYSFLLQGIYRYVIAVYPTRLFSQTVKIQILFICITWIFGFLYPLAFMFTGDITYNYDNQICQIPLRLSFSLIFVICNAYLIPVWMIQLIYFKLVRYVKEVSRHVTTTGISLSRIERELKMVRRIIIIVTILVILGLPYTVFIFMSFFTDPPKYHYQIAGLFINSAVLFVMMALFLFTDPLKSAVFKRINLRSETVVPVVVWHR
jgi:hypothetical protein